MTPLHVAAEKGECHKIVKYLIDKGTDINIKDYSGVSETTVLVQQKVLYPCLFIVLFEVLQAMMRMSPTHNLQSEITM